ncbi:conserved hypothetical protein [Flavobacterium sp. 9AF]|uniref:hypothetical protein n=1 Tax=Flavobacterium sp. 9AF TaxID=2653142 RepID=UPI0012F052B2|nr:hypothetical protein [Flavobacterium sp. 9AF]VXB04620.1 conserved hypothetical protein [Flavobacterium sp. 9AF]
MTHIEVFYELKNSVLQHYKKRYPYFNGNWKTFSSQDILNLIEDVEEKCKASVSEKWIYTHLKPETNEKLPRKDMLDIFSQYIGLANWDAFQYEHNQQKTIEVSKKSLKSRKLLYISLSVFVFLIIIGLYWQMTKKTLEKKTIHLEEKFTQDSVIPNITKAYIIEDSVEKEIVVKSSKIEVNKEAKVVVKSPFYKEKTVDLKQNPEIVTITLEPNDYANILQGFIKSDIKDWETRKEQLEKILHDNVEVIVMLPNNLGAEYFNKDEFSQKLIIPTASLKKMKIVEVKNEANNQIIFIRLIQE